MLTFLQFIEEQDELQEGKLKKSALGLALAGAMGVGAAGGAKLHDHHAAEKARVERIMKATHDALNDPFQGQMDGDYVDPHSSFLRGISVPDGAEHAKIKQVMTKHGEKGKVKAIDPESLNAMKKGFQSYKAGKFSINSGPPAKGIDPWYDNTKVSK